MQASTPDHVQGRNVLESNKKPVTLYCTDTPIPRQGPVQLLCSPVMRMTQCILYGMGYGGKKEPVLYDM